jgi:AcrR family transcriptional regulator
MPTPPPSAALDRRISKTRVALLDALLRLLPEKGWDDLNVQEICESANVGRSTFYTHYNSKDDLLSEGLNSLRIQLGNIASHANHDPKPLAFISSLLQHMIEQRRIFKAVIGKRSGHIIERRFREMVHQLVLDDLSKLTHEGGQLLVASHYIAGALVDVMSWWLEEPNAPTPEALEIMIRQFTDPVLTNVKNLENT